jgi:YesN/AraC family two-component response regulator
MLKMLIVEDERAAREGLVDFWDWNSLDIEIVGAACDGIEGLELAQSLRPDIIITDIKMPVLHGLDMSKQIKEFLPNVKIIILSGYDDFKFAKEAIGFGANEYILKPVEEEGMLLAINKVIMECKREKDRTEWENKIKYRLEETFGAAKAKLLVDFKEGNLINNQKKNSKEENIANKVIKLIEEKYMEEICLKTIAAEVYLSPNYLGNIFKKAVGKTFNEYLCEYRMQKAKELLSKSNKKVCAVAQEVGIPNISYFCILFKNAYGIAPGEFQNMILRGE